MARGKRLLDAELSQAPEVSLCIETARRYVIINANSLYSQCLLTALRIVDSTTDFEAYPSVADWLQSAHRTATSLVVVFTSDAMVGDFILRDRNLLQLRTFDARFPYVIMADDAKPGQIVSALRNGAKGFIPTSFLVQEIVQALRFVDAGGVFAPASGFLDMACSREHGTTTDTPNPFTPRQLSVVKALRTGMPNKTIAYELNMCESTVKVHVRAIMKKMRARNRTEVVVSTDWLFPE
jgi:DNA-binding NarL/FixJ family response regulator